MGWNKRLAFSNSRFKQVNLEYKGGFISTLNISSLVAKKQVKVTHSWKWLPLVPLHTILHWTMTVEWLTMKFGVIAIKCWREKVSVLVMLMCLGHIRQHLRVCVVGVNVKLNCHKNIYLYKSQSRRSCSEKAFVMNGWWWQELLSVWATRKKPLQYYCRVCLFTGFFAAHFQVKRYENPPWWLFKDSTRRHFSNLLMHD